eukprot:gnl/Dysnectes_brevis/2394_a2838_1133.p1 GENE.gnl/Dysnectes_brevis/2394_a2838_1133~~gnl/Dysnectes_brevis/2394_a2838_1133.p1  ORF type:complete len:439 (+),score=204.68 gnl/Dysnectes_brevis/2394_a2838_1133:59-1318(+)
MISQTILSKPFATTAGIKFGNYLSKEIDAIKTAGLYKAERIITGKQGPEIVVTSSDEPVLLFCSNNYLGFCDSPELIQTAKDTLDKFGYGMSSVRFICGTQTQHKELEHLLAEFHGTEDAILFSSCFDANAAIFEALLGPEDLVLSDQLNHASIIDGLRLCKAKKKVYKHNDMADLERLLEEFGGQYRHIMIATDSTFSMDGDVADLKTICDLADKFGALTFIDESHSCGVIGATGRGGPEHCGVEGRIDIINSTMGKAMGGASGGYTAATAEIVEMLRQRGRPYLFSNTLAPAIVGASIASFSMLMKDPSPVKQLHANAIQFRDSMTDAGFDLRGDPTHPIAPVMLYDDILAGEMAKRLLSRSLYVTAFSFPVVPKGEARIRVQLSARHTPEMIDRAVTAFTEIKKEMEAEGFTFPKK